MMQNKFTRLVCGAVAALGVCLLAGCATRPVVNGVPNFAEVKPGLFRGGQPNEQGWQFLRSLGVTNVVKLNRENEDLLAEGMNLQFIPLPPATFGETLRKPGSNDVWRAVQLMKTGGTYVHCRHGRDRTGVVVACYRIWVDGWIASDAAREMSAMGFRWSLPGLRGFWRSVSREKEKK